MLHTPSTYERCLACYKNSCTAAVVDSSGAIVFWRSDDAGFSWRLQDPHLPYHVSPSGYAGYLWTLQQIDSLHAVAFGDSARIVSTSDGGETWQVEQGPTNVVLTNGYCDAPERGIALGQFSNKILVNDGMGWDFAPFARYTSDYQVPPACYAGASGSYKIVTGQRFTDSVTLYRIVMFRTSDNWSSVDSSVIASWRVEDTTFKAFPFTVNFTSGGDTVIVAGTQLLLDGTKGCSLLARSFDGGMHWQTFIDSTNALKGFWATKLAGNILYSLLRSDTVSSTSSLYVSHDYGATWSIEQAIFPDSIGKVHIVQFVPSAVSDGSIIARFYVVDSAFDRRLNFIARAYAPVASVGESTQRTRLAVYPNPAITELHINTGSNASIVDALGRMYDVPYHEGTLDISLLPAGVYYLNAGNERATFVKK